MKGSFPSSPSYLLFPGIRFDLWHFHSIRLLKKVQAVHLQLKTSWTSSSSSSWINAFSRMYGEFWHPMKYSWTENSTILKFSFFFKWTIFIKLGVDELGLSRSPNIKIRLSEWNHLNRFDRLFIFMVSLIVSSRIYTIISIIPV